MREKAAVLPDVCEEWRPDAIVCDETDFGSLITAERLRDEFATLPGPEHAVTLVERLARSCHPALDRR